MQTPDAILNPEQKKAVYTTKGAVLVTAGAGSGKTRVLTHRIAHLIKSGVKPYNILAVTFTNKAASEMKQRVIDLVNDLNAHNVWVSTFHSMCVQMLRQNKNIEHFKGYDTNFSIYDTSDKERILKTLIAENKIQDEDFLKTVSFHISNYKNKNLTIDNYASELYYQHNADTIIDIIRKYEKKMNANNALDFDSLLTYTCKLLKQNADVLDHYQNKFEYIHIDEFQDTNSVQYDLVKLLSGKYKNIFVVGDEDQCIYTWRGANSNHIIQFKEDFEPVTLIKLEQNYRSTKKIIDLANKVIKENTSRLDKNLWTDKEEGVRVEYKTNYNERQEASYVAEHIYNLVRMNNYKYSEIAVLMRLNALTRHFESKFLEYNIPHQVFGGRKFYDRQEVKNVLAYLKLIVNKKDASSFNRIINFPKRGIGKVALLNLKQQVKQDESPLEAVLELNKDNTELSSSVLNKFLQFAELIKNINKNSNQMKLSELIEYVLDITGIKEAYDENKEEDINRLYNLSELVNSVKEYEKNNPSATLEEYLQSVSLTADIDDYDQYQDKVTLATVHSVKGLEFKSVFIVGAEENIFPLKRGDRIEDLQEERRLMYVAITRAQKRLYITNAMQRYLYGNIKFMQPSRFLKEAGLIQVTEETNSLNNGFASTSKTNKFTSNQDVKIVDIKSTKTDVKSIAKLVKVGDKVVHPKFGTGVVLSVSGSMQTKTASIKFDQVGTKTLALNFAPLTFA